MCITPIKHTEEHFAVQSSVVAYDILMGNSESLLWNATEEMNIENQVSAQHTVIFISFLCGLFFVLTTWIKIAVIVKLQYSFFKAAHLLSCKGKKSLYINKSLNFLMQNPTVNMGIATTDRWIVLSELKGYFY